MLASLLMLSGSMGDRFGRRRVFQIGLVLFTLASLLCSVAPSLGWLIAFRMLQAVGGSMLNPVAMSIIRNVFTDAARAGAGDRRVGGDGRDQPRARPGRRRRARRVRRLALDLLDQHPGRPARARADDALRARVARAAPAAPRPGRPGARDRDARVADLRDHRGARRAGWASAQSIALFALAAVALVALILYERAARRAAARAALLPQRALLERERDRGLLASPRSAGSCS